MDMSQAISRPFVDHKARAIVFHRRAQNAEAAAQRWEREADLWKLHARRNGQARHKAACEVTRLKVALHNARLHQTDALARIIYLGEQFP